jgi:hypothetical protein
MRRKSLYIVLILSLAINVSVLATIGYHFYRNACIAPSAPCPLNPSDRHLYESLGLSSGQMAQMSPLARLFHDRLNGLESAIAVKRNLLIDVLGEDGIDLPRTEAIRREIASLQDEIQKEVITHIAESKKIMNLDQQKRFIELLRTSANNGQSNSPFAKNGGNH